MSNLYLMIRLTTRVEPKLTDEKLEYALLNVFILANQGCNGDPHAVVKECPLPCPSTCDAPDAVNCLKLCDPVGCECEPGYIRSHYNGKCILPEECPCKYTFNLIYVYIFLQKFIHFIK